MFSSQAAGLCTVEIFGTVLLTIKWSLIDYLWNKVVTKVIRLLHWIGIRPLDYCFRLTCWFGLMLQMRTQCDWTSNSLSWSLRLVQSQTRKVSQRKMPLCVQRCYQQCWFEEQSHDRHHMTANTGHVANFKIASVFFFFLFWNLSFFISRICDVRTQNNRNDS